jgi:hypothetical protein
LPTDEAMTRRVAALVPCTDKFAAAEFAATGLAFMIAFRTCAQNLDAALYLPSFTE